MSRFLLRLYPVSNQQELEIYQLDYLPVDYVPPISDHWGFDVDGALSMYNQACDRNGCIRGFTHYNNSVWYKGEANNIFDFVSKFREELEKKRNDE